MSDVLRNVSIASTTTIEKNATVRVSVMTVFQGAAEDHEGEMRWTWFNRVTLHNLSERAIQIYGRHLEETAYSPEGNENSVRSGRGVVGVMPIVATNTSFWFLSHVELGRPSGTAGGHYHALVMQTGSKDSRHFDLHIPEVQLIAPAPPAPPAATQEPAPDEPVKPTTPPRGF
jgi:uncharacterized protein affecting Mg2+/Co2+ transport